MSQVRKLLLSFVGLLSILASFSIDAQQIVAVERGMILTPTPTPKEVIVTPEGYANCFTVKAGWYKDMWIPEHRVCQYENAPLGVAWVEGYWSCNKYEFTGTEGKCLDWEWKPGRWERVLTVY